MERSDLQRAFYETVLEEINSENPEDQSLELLEDTLVLAKTQFELYAEISDRLSTDIYNLKKQITELNQHISLVSSERDKIKSENQGSSSLYSELLKQRDAMESNLVNIRSSHCKCREQIENSQIEFENKKKTHDEKEKELKILLEELKGISETGARTAKSMDTPKKKDIPKMEIKSFPASSYSFNFGIRNNNQSKDRIVLNRSFNNGEKSSRSSNVSNNNSMIIES